MVGIKREDVTDGSVSTAACAGRRQRGQGRGRRISIEAGPLPLNRAN
jgi:hypothetical protein